MSQDDALTSQKNQVVATNSLNQTWINYLRAEHGTETSKCVEAPTVIAIGDGRLVCVSVVEKSTTQTPGMIYNQATAESPQDANRIMAIPADIGVYNANLLFTSGLLIVPATGQGVTVTYTTD